jgi:hypothetical protein
MRRFLVTVQVILVVAGLGLGGYVGYRAFSLMGKDSTGQLQSYLVLAVLALVLVAAAGVARPAPEAEIPEPAPLRRAPGPPPGQPGPLGQPPYQGPGGYRPGGPHTGSQPPIGPGGPHTGPQPAIGGGPHTGSQPPIGGPEQYGGGRTEQYPRP